MRVLLAILLLLFCSQAHATWQGQGMSKALVVSSCGGGAAPNGSLTNLTMDPTGRLCQSGIGSNICPQAAAYLGRTVGGTEGGNAVNITTLICGLVTDGVWAHLDALYVLAQQNATDSLLNLIGTSYAATNVNSASFTTYRGYSFGSTAYLDTHFNASTATSPNFTQHFASVGIWINLVIPDVNEAFGNGSAAGPSGGSHIQIYTDNHLYVRINNNNTSGVANPGTKGWYSGDRSDVLSTVASYWDGVSQGSQVTSDAPALNADFLIGRAPGDPSTVQTLGAASMGGTLGATGQLALYTRLRTYMTAVGVP